MRLIKFALVSVAGIITLGLAVPAMAQTSNLENAFHQKGTQARLTLKIPLGAKLKTSSQKPRLHLGVRQYYDTGRENRDWWQASSTPNFKETSLSFSLEKDPKFFIGEQAITFKDSETAQVSDAVKIGGGVIAGAVLVVGGTFLLLSLNPVSDE